MLKRDNLFPYLIISIFLHIAIYFLFHSNGSPVFSSSLIEVSFYSPSSQKTEQSAPAFAWEQIKSNDTTEDIVAKKKKFSGEKVDGLKPEEKLKVQIETDTKKYGKQSTKPIEKKTEMAESSGNSGSVETFQTPATDKLSVGAGSQYEGLSFDAKNFKYYYSYYSGQIIRKIRGQWRLGENYGKLRALVYFKIYRNGTISDIFVKESSKNGEYDRYALDTVRRAEPFPDLPDDYEGDSLGVFFEFKNGN